jgi:hypothetical protein
VVIETAVDLAIEGDLLVRLQDDSGKLAVYVSVFALAQYVFKRLSTSLFDTILRFSIFQLVMAVDAVYARNTLQFMSLM